VYLENIYTDDLKPVKVSSDQGDKLVQESIGRRRTWLDMTRQFRDDALEVRQLYIENRPGGQAFASDEVEAESKSNVRMPIMAQSVDATLAQQHLGTYPTDERFFKADPKTELSKENQLPYEDTVEKRLSLLNFMHKSKMDRMNAMLDGVSTVWHPFCRKTRNRAVYKPRTIFGIPFGKPRKSYVEQVYLEGTDFIPLNLEDWWIDPTVDDFDACNFIWRQWVSVEYLKTIKAYANTEDVTNFSTVSDDADSRLRQNYEMMGFDIDLTEAEDAMSKSMAMLFEEWGDFYIDGELYENHVLIYSNESVFHGLFPNPFDHGYKPFSIGSYVPLPGTLMGKSLGKNIVPLVHAYDAFINGAIDIVNSSAAPVWTYLSSDNALVELFSEGKMIVEPGRVFPVQSHDSLHMHQGDLSHLNVVDLFMQRIKEVAQESTGGVNYATGGIQDLGPDRTATEVNTLASGTSTRYQDLIQNYEEFKLKRFLWMWFENDRQFLSEPLFAQDEPLTPDMIQQMDFEFEVIGSKTAMSQSKESNALMAIFGMLPQMFQLGNFKVKGDVIEVDVGGMVTQFGRTNGSRNIDDYFNVVMTAEEAEQQQPTGLEEMINGLGQAQPGGSPLDLGGIPV
jgi:hypothetical protein